jgi:hypothetical protein
MALCPGGKFSLLFWLVQCPVKYRIIIKHTKRLCARLNARCSLQSLEGGFRSFVISGIFSPVNRSQEEAVGQILLEEANVWAKATGTFPSPTLGPLLCVYCVFFCSCMCTSVCLMSRIPMFCSINTVLAIHGATAASDLKQAVKASWEVLALESEGC